MGVEGVLNVKYIFEVNEPLDQCVSRGPPQHVVQASSNEHPHGPDLLLIVDLKGMGQVGNGAPRDGNPAEVLNNSCFLHRKVGCEPISEIFITKWL